VVRPAAIVLVVAAALAVGAAASCTLFEGDIPDKTCKTDDDCFRAQGEHCDVATKECVMAATPDAPPAAIDAAAADAAIDATFAVTSPGAP